MEMTPVPLIVIDRVALLVGDAPGGMTCDNRTSQAKLPGTYRCRRHFATRRKSPDDCGSVLARLRLFSTLLKRTLKLVRAKNRWPGLAWAVLHYWH